MTAHRCVFRYSLPAPVLRYATALGVSFGLAAATASGAFAAGSCGAPATVGSNLQVTCTGPGSVDFVVPTGVTELTINAFGAQGGGPSGTGALGAEATSTFTVTPGQTLTVDIGGQGGVTSGGFNGGANGGAGGSLGGGGGGASDVRSGTSFLIVAGGGGGNGGIAGHGTGGAGGNPDGAFGLSDVPNRDGPRGGAGGSTTNAAGGSGGSGGVIGARGADAGANGVASHGGAGGSGRSLPGFGTGSGGGGGGGGFFGGGGGGGAIGDQHGAGGGGGSSFGPSGTVFAAGVRSGDGEVVITFAAPVCTVNCNTGAPGGTTPNPAATPELDSVLLFAAGTLGLAGYARLRLRGVNK